MLRPTTSDAHRGGSAELKCVRQRGWLPSVLVRRQRLRLAACRRTRRQPDRSRLGAASRRCNSGTVERIAALRTQDVQSLSEDHRWVLCGARRSVHARTWHIFGVRGSWIRWLWRQPHSEQQYTSDYLFKELVSRSGQPRLSSSGGSADTKTSSAGPQYRRSSGTLLGHIAQRLA